jgi:molybdopterin-guanine dinucleotide biosynthesis protein A
MPSAAGIVLAGGRSSRMGRPKAALEWHGTTLLRRVVGIVGRAVDGPVVVVGAPGQELPALPPDVLVATDAREGRGPLQGLAAGLEAVADSAELAYVSATDVPLLHPAFVAAVVRAAEPVDVALPVAHGFRNPMAAAYRIALLPVVERLLAADRLKPDFLFAEARVRELDEAELLRDPDLARADPELLSLEGINDPAEYERAQARPAPAVTVHAEGLDPLPVRAATLGAAAAAAGIALRPGDDPDYPLATGDVVSFPAGATV